jgi:hypothetical protein
MATCVHGTVWSGVGRPTCLQCLEAREERIYDLASKDIDAAQEKLARVTKERDAFREALAGIALEPCCFAPEPCYGCYSCHARKVIA